MSRALSSANLLPPGHILNDQPIKLRQGKPVQAMLTSWTGYQLSKLTGDLSNPVTCFFIREVVIMGIAAAVLFTAWGAAKAKILTPLSHRTLKNVISSASTLTILYREVVCFRSILRQEKAGELPLNSQLSAYDFLTHEELADRRLTVARRDPYSYLEICGEKSFKAGLYALVQSFCTSNRTVLFDAIFNDQFIPLARLPLALKLIFESDYLYEICCPQITQEGYSSQKLWNVQHDQLGAVLQKGSTCDEPFSREGLKLTVCDDLASLESNTRLNNMYILAEVLHKAFLNQKVYVMEASSPGLSESLYNRIFKDGQEVSYSRFIETYNAKVKTS